MTRPPYSCLDSLEGTAYLFIAMALTPFVLLWELAARRMRRRAPCHLTKHSLR